MAPRSAVFDLASEHKEELDSRLVKGGFRGYMDLAEWLQDLGYDISKSSVHRYGKDFEDRLGTLKIVTEQCKAVVAQSPDEQGVVNEALIRLVQEQVFSMLMDVDVSFKAKDIASLTRAVANISRASVSQKRLMNEYRERIADKAEKTAIQKGLSKEDANFLRSQILGVEISD